MDSLFINKALSAFKSIFSKKQQFKNIVSLANKYYFLFNSKILDVKNSVQRNKSDYSCLRSEFFYGKFTRIKDNKSTRTKEPIWDEVYWYFLIIANFINKNKDITSLNDGMHRLMLNYCFNYCVIKIFIILRTIFNKKMSKKDDINIWNLKSVKNGDPKYAKWLNSLYKHSNFENFIRYINKRIVHITSTYKKPFWINSAFNVFESLYIITKIIFWENRPKNARYWRYDINLDVDSNNRYDGDLLRIDKLKHSEKLYWDEYKKKIIQHSEN